MGLWFAIFMVRKINTKMINNMGGNERETYNKNYSEMCLIIQKPHIW